MESLYDTPGSPAQLIIRDLTVPLDAVDVIQRLSNPNCTPVQISMLSWVSATPGVSDPRHACAVADQEISYLGQFEAEDITL